jgi:hypothetical protein
MMKSSSCLVGSRRFRNTPRALRLLIGAHTLNPLRRKLAVDASLRQMML